MGIKFWNRLQLLARNEGKIKSYESCEDIRAWSHDCVQRDRYLRDWMKTDMPFFVMPVCTLAGLLRAISCKSRGRASPRCHPDCKSKAVLDSICTSFNAMKECLRNDKKFEKYFVEEELETSHWPCERCLEALKTIKMFWKVILEKVLRINLNKDDITEGGRPFCRSESVRELAKTWQQEMVAQAMIVQTCCIPMMGCKSSKSQTKTSEKNSVTCISSCKKPGCSSFILGHPSDSSANCFTPSNKSLKKCCCTRAKPKQLNKSCMRSSQANCCLIKQKSCDQNRKSILVNKDNCKRLTLRCTENGGLLLSSKSSKSTVNCECGSKNRVTISDSACERRCSKSTSVRVRTLDMGCDTSLCKLNNDDEELRTYKANFDYLQKSFDVQREEIDKLKKENTCLKVQMQKQCAGKWTSAFCYPTVDFDNDAVALVQPFESFMDDSKPSNLVKDVDSEMIITMKNCKNENFRHISLLQVLHKTNEPVTNEINLEGRCHRKEDPVDLLTKVQNTLGAIVRREMSIASGRKHGRKSEIDATFQKVNASRSAPSCGTLHSSWKRSNTNCGLPDVLKDVSKGQAGLHTDVRKTHRTQYDCIELPTHFMK